MNKPCWIFYGTNNQNLEFVEGHVVPALSLDVKYWIGGLPDLGQEVRKKFPKTIYLSQDESNAWIDSPIGKSDSFPDLITPDFLLALQNIFIRFKFAYNYTIPFDEQNHMVNVARTIFNKLQEEKIELVIFFEYPHSIGSYVTYLLCQHLRIKFVIRTLSPFEDRVFYTSRIQDGIPSYYSDLDEDARKAFDQILLKASKSYAETQPSYTKSQTRRLFLVSKARKFSSFAKQQVWRRAFRKLVNKSINLSSTKFIYVGLHYQPELTSFPLGGLYNNQHLMILMLSAVIPDDWKIIVKEHPTTYKYVKKNMTLYRSEQYYKFLKNIPKVDFVDYTFDSYELIDKSIVSATLTGTTGYESVLRGKPCIVFGDAPYLGCEGVYRVTDFQSLKEIWNKIKANNFRLDKEKVVSYTQHAMANTLLSRTNIDFDKFDSGKQLDYLLKSL